MTLFRAILVASSVFSASSAFAQTPATSPAAPQTPGIVKLADVRMRDACVLPDEATQTYYIVAAGRGGSVRAYTSKDLIHWEGPQTIFETPPNFWPGVEMRGIWAPELHKYRGKYYLFLTFDTNTKLAEQWPNWVPRVRRGSQVLVSDSPLGPFEPFANRPTLPEDMMTLDGTLWIEDGVPYMVYCHEWVQIVNGTVETIRLKEDLSAADGEPVRLFFGNDAPWSKRSDQHGCWVTDGPSLLRSKSGKLFMLWSSGSGTGYTTGVAISDSGKLAGPWRHQTEPIFSADGGHPTIFTRFDGQLMMVLHQPNKAAERARLFELEDTGETLRILRPFPNP
jgi:arabinan endo-1,5-alpha-L-arabinosidase